MEPEREGSGSGLQSTTYRQARPDPGIGFAIVGLLVLAGALATGYVAITNGWYTAGVGGALIAVSPLLVLFGLYSIGPRGQLRRLFMAPSTVTIDGSGIAWTLPGSAASVDWSRVGGLEDAPARGPLGTIVRDEHGQFLVRLPSALVANGIRGSHSLVDLVVAARPDRYELVPGFPYRSCILRAVVEAERSAAPPP